jgi:hypothetical protein
VSASSTSVVNVANVVFPVASPSIIVKGNPADCQTLVPQLAGSLSPTSFAAGGSTTHVATLTGATTPAATGSVTVNVYSGDSSSSCTGVPVVSAQSAPPSVSANFGDNLQPGFYEVQAVYSGDSRNADAVSPCGSIPLTVLPKVAPPNLLSCPLPGGISCEWAAVGGVALLAAAVLARIATAKRPATPTLPDPYDLRLRVYPLKPESKVVEGRRSSQQ